MRNGLWIVLAAWLPAGVAAQIPYVYPFNAMTGQEVIDHRLKVVRTQLDYLNRAKVDAYLNGIRDGAHGRDWCLATPMLPDELNAAVVGRLKAGYKPAVLKDNAAPLVLAELGRQFPCKRIAKPVSAPVKKAVRKAANKPGRPQR